jgi:hypothetical protein
MKDFKDTDMKEKASDRKIEANRANAKKSTGPNTFSGKRIASLNAITVGIYAKSVVAKGPPFVEDPALFVRILASLRAHWQPIGLIENAKVEELAIVTLRKVRLERFESAGISERMWSSIDAVRHRNQEERFDDLRHGPLGLGERPQVTATQLLDQRDLVQRLRDGAPISEESDFLAFVYLEKVGDGDQEPSLERLKEVFMALSEEEKDDLEDRFFDQAELVLKAMWDNRGATAAEEAALGRTLIPDEAEMNKILRYSAHLNRAEDKAILRLQQLQAGRRSKEGKQ